MNSFSTIIPAPYFKRWGKHPAIKAVVDGITAAAIGAIAGAVVILAKRQFTYPYFDRYCIGYRACITAV